jgi:hypothetical protein
MNVSSAELLNLVFIIFNRIMYLPVLSVVSVIFVCKQSVMITGKWRDTTDKTGGAGRGCYFFSRCATSRNEWRLSVNQ